jgi:alpha-L-arabinofuranosidase
MDAEFNVPLGIKIMKLVFCVIGAVLSSLPCLNAIADPTSDKANTVYVTVGTDKPGIPLNPAFYGLMTEEINHAFDGGLYAELIQNRNFKQDLNNPVHWSLVQNGTGTGQLALSGVNPLTSALVSSLNISITTASASSRVGAANDGYWGIPVKPFTTYTASFYAEASAGFSGPVAVSLEKADGSIVYATASVPAVTSNWAHYVLTLKSGPVIPSENNRFVIYGTHPGTLRLSLVSLFPPTYNDRINGNRLDLMEKLAAMKPSFLRLPGGNYLDPGHFVWKSTIGPLKDRPGSPGAWSYPVTQGLGLLEMLEWCQDLHIQPLLAVSDGRGWLPDNADITPLVQDAVDEIQYVTGPVDTKWGAERARDGHLAPFPLKYVEIGNEDQYGNRDVYNTRFAQFYDAIKAKYPHLLIIATRRDIVSRVPDLFDEHYYRTAHQMEEGAYQYDDYARSGPKIFVGEWATTQGSPTPYYYAAISDAAWLTGLERNADIVSLESYAPLFVNVNPGASQWGTNLIGYDALNSFGSPSYYVQSLFSGYHGNSELPTVVSSNPIPIKPILTGGVGVGSSNTEVEYKDPVVTSDGVTISPTKGSGSFDNWQSVTGTWNLAGDILTQSDASGNDHYISLHPDWTNYSFEVKARKLSGQEGFRVLVHVLDSNNFVSWNVGGWGNSSTIFERNINGDNEQFGPIISSGIDTGRWYDVSVVVNGTDIKGYLDGKLISETTDYAPEAALTVYASASRVSSNGDILLHVVNSSESSQPILVSLEGVHSVNKIAYGKYLSGQPNDQNTIVEPTKIAPISLKITNAAPKFEAILPAYSVTVLRLTAVKAAISN